MAIKSSIHIKPCNTKSSEAHNRRTAEYMRNIGESKIYIVSELSADNEQWVNPDFGNPNLQTHYDLSLIHIYYILYHQNLQGWGSKIIKQLAKAIRFNYPEKKGYSERNLTYMCQFARSYPLNVLRSFIDTDARLSVPSIQNVTDEVLKLNNGQFTQELTAQIQSTDSQLLEFTQEPLAQIQNVAKTVSAIYRITIEDIEKLFLASPVARINWASHVIMLNNSLPLGVKYWYMKQSVEMGWSSNVLKIQIETNLYNRQISNNKVNNFTATLPAPQSDLANYLLKDPYIFDLAGAKEKADERDIEEQLVKHVTRYLLEMGNGFAFVARQKHFQIGNSDFFADLILYSIPLHAYIVVELKATPFKPEYAGQLNFYINVVDDKMLSLIHILIVYWMIVADFRIDTFVISMVSYIIAMENIHHLMMYAKMRYPKSAE